MAARIDPLELPRPPQPGLDPTFHGLTNADLDWPVSTHEVPGPPIRPLREVLDGLRTAYCGSEGLIPLLDLAIETAAGHGVEEVVLGMARRLPRTGEAGASRRL